MSDKIKIIQCDCKDKNSYQDRTYGKQMRVHNKMMSSKSYDKFRCTICQKEK